MDDWAIDAQQTALVGNPAITIWEADARDSDGKVWKGLASKVTLEGLGFEGKAERVFVGETAWSDATRYAMDLSLRLV